MINAGRLAHPIHMHGHSFKIVATDGNPVPAGMEWTKDTVLIGPSERYDLEFDANNPGVWMFHCHIEHHMANGMMTVIQYEGHSPSGPAAEFFEEMQSPAAVPDHEDHDSTVPSSPVTSLPDPATEVPTSNDDTVEVLLIDDRFDPVWIEIPAGTTVVWVNKGADWHNVASSKAGFASDKILPGEHYEFTFTIPGEYKVVCRHHGLAGMNGTIVVI